jgi:ABC-type phosphate transport system substrate-binding protein
MQRLAAIIGALCLGAICVGASTSTPTKETELAVVVHRDRQATLSVEELRNVFLKKRRFWDDGAPIVPLNREPGSVERETFSRRVLGGASATLMSYWNREYFHGIFPPATLSSADAVKRYVAADRNAVGYVAVDDVDASVRVVLRVK